MSDLHAFAGVLERAASQASKMAADAVTAEARVIQDDAAFGEPVVALFTGPGQVHLAGVSTDGVLGGGTTALSDFNPSHAGAHLAGALLERGVEAVLR